MVALKKMACKTTTFKLNHKKFAWCAIFAACYPLVTKIHFKP